MNALHPRRIHRGMAAAVTAGLALLALGAIAPMSAQAAVTCTPAETMTGAHNGAINVAGGEKLCVTNADQTGALTVDPNGTLSVRNSTITGSVSLFSGYTEFEFCGSKTVGGAISATGGAGTVLIGDTGLLGPDRMPVCASNTIDGAVTLDANQAGVTLAHNEIKAAVTASANLVATNIVGNHIGGALTCTGNDPAPNNIGLFGANVVGGERFGQTCLDGNF
jgi:hexosaminidase